MSDLDANGNVDYSNIPAFTVRGKQTNAIDIRRSIGKFPTIHDVSSDLVQVNTPFKFFTIKELTGVATATEGIEILHHGMTFSSFMTNRGNNILVKLSGVTGTVTSPPTADFFKDVFMVNRTILGNGVAGLSADPNAARSEGIFIPCTDLSQISIAGITNQNSQFISSTVSPLFKQVIEVQIK